MFNDSDKAILEKNGFTVGKLLAAKIGNKNTSIAVVKDSKYSIPIYVLAIGTEKPLLGRNLESLLQSAN